MITLRVPTRAVKRASLEAASGVQLSECIDRVGWSCLENAITADWAAAALREARSQTAVGDYEVILDDLESTPSSVGHQVAHDPALRHLFEEIVASAAPDIDTTGDAIRTSLRVVVGEDPLNRPLNFHYDRSILTMVIPLQMPSGAAGAAGELILAPNHRPYRKSAAVNIIEKAAVQSRHFRRWFSAHLPANTLVLPLTVGNAYMFWGYRSYHTTLPCPVDSMRVSLILHFGEVHDGSRVLALFKSTGRSWRLRRDSTIRIHAA